MDTVAEKGQKDQNDEDDPAQEQEDGNPFRMPEPDPDADCEKSDQCFHQNILPLPRVHVLLPVRGLIRKLQQCGELQENLLRFCST